MLDTKELPISDGIIPCAIASKTCEACSCGNDFLLNSKVTHGNVDFDMGDLITL